MDLAANKKLQILEQIWRSCKRLGVGETANVKFSPAVQSAYCLIDKKAIYPVNNKWGLQGWTTFQLARADSQLMLDALNTAYNDVLKVR